MHPAECELHALNAGATYGGVGAGRSDAGRILRDLASREHVDLFRGPALLTSIPLAAAGAIEKLRECSLNGGEAR